ncbi:hypothetical protein BASA60_001267 [Batrachochytrium salamandrivorans]|nr:hypothetical protein BASA60_001267 [Batrachochytrium salamandrivorans]
MNEIRVLWCSQRAIAVCVSTHVFICPASGILIHSLPKICPIFKERIRDCLKTHNINSYSLLLTRDDEEPLCVLRASSLLCHFLSLPAENDVMVTVQACSWSRISLGCCRSAFYVNRTHMHDLITSTEAEHYESFRSTKLTTMGRSDDDPVAHAKKSLASKMKEDEEALRKRFTEQVRQEESRFRQWEQKLISERDRLNKDLEEHHKLVKDLEHEYEDAQAQARAGPSLNHLLSMSHLGEYSLPSSCFA